MNISNGLYLDGSISATGRVYEHMFLYQIMVNKLLAYGSCIRFRRDFITTEKHIFELHSAAGNGYESTRKVRPEREVPIFSMST
jgi:hypothetical protein